nr:hypothetical protein [Tanacetum cinerariifolium]
MIYENSKKEKRVMVIKKILKLCDATLKRLLENVKKFNLDVKHGYADPDLNNEDAEYMEFYEEIENYESLAFLSYYLYNPKPLLRMEVFGINIVPFSFDVLVVWWVGGGRKFLDDDWPNDEFDGGWWMVAANHGFGAECAEDAVMKERNTRKLSEV